MFLKKSLQTKIFKGFMVLILTGFSIGPGFRNADSHLLTMPQATFA
jgi:hypothetical protein